MTDWRRSYADQKPEALDFTSSPTTVYERKDFEEIEVPSMMEGEEPRTQWTYLEKTYTRDEYYQIKAITDAISLKHDNEVIDDYTNSLLEEGIL